MKEKKINQIFGVNLENVSQEIVYNNHGEGRIGEQIKGGELSKIYSAVKTITKLVKIIISLTYYVIGFLYLTNTF